MEEIIGDDPALDGEMRTMVEFEAAIICVHGYTAAPQCAMCHRPNWLDCPVRSDTLGIQRTVRDVVQEFLEAKKISSAKVVRRHFRKKRREARTAARAQEQIVVQPQKRVGGRTYKKWSVIAGLTVVSGIVIYEGGKLVLKLLAERAARKEQEPKP